MKHLALTIMAIVCSFATFASIPAFTPSSGGICIGSGLYLNDSLAPGGTWSSSNITVATVSTGGYVSGLSAGTVTITYTTTSGFTTGVFTVSASPAAITGGPTQFCAGLTGTMMDATPGGVWSSSDPSVATVDPTTGVVTGVSAGYPYIYYTVGACSVMVMDTINATTAPMITGPTNVCVGSTITLTDSTGGLLGGGTWISSNTSIATVAGGVVTGVSNGTVTISLEATGTCGAAYGTWVVTVGPVGAGYIDGTGTLSVSETASFYDYGGPSGGTWTINPVSVATINPTTGDVTGVSPGTATITYSAMSCSVLTTTTDVITVTSLNGISGNVVFPAAFGGMVKVWLITYNSSTLDLEAADSLTLYCSGSSVFYEFTGLSTDSFRVKAATNDSGTITTGYIPTYHTSSYYWHDANVIYHVSGTSDINKDIDMLSGTTTSGPGFIAGNVTTGANKGTSGSVPVTRLHMVALNTSTTPASIAEMTYTDASGNYSFTSLPYGTYTVFPDSVNYITTPYNGITLSASVSSANATFVQHTLSKTITPILAGVKPVNPTVSSVWAFPNPTNGKLNIQWNEKTSEKATISISDVTGRVVYTSFVNMNEGNGATVIDLSTLTNSTYMISIKSALLDYNNKIEVLH